MKYLDIFRKDTLERENQITKASSSIDQGQEEKKDMKMEHETQVIEIYLIRVQVRKNKKKQ